MNNRLFIFLELVSLLFCFSCNYNKDIDSNANIVVGKVNSIYSQELNEERTIWVYVPNNIYESSNVDKPYWGKKKYPVIYVLDGDAHFMSLIGINQQLSQANGNDYCPEAIIIGINNTNRWRDFTPTSSSIHENTGGSQVFLDFLEKELIPYVDKNYPTLPNRTIVGHSLGGLLVLEALLTRNALFDSYLAVDPSLWYDDNYLGNKTKSEIKKRSFEGKSLYISIAKTFQNDIPFEELKNDTSLETEHVRAIIDYMAIIENVNKLNWDSGYFYEEDHTTVPMPSEYVGLKFLFNYYPFDIYSYIDMDDHLLDSIIDKHYDMISKKMGGVVLPQETKINDIAYYFLNEKQYERALRWFKKNIEYYPNSSNAFDGLGDYYAKINDIKTATKFYQKSLKLLFNPETKKKLDKLN